MTRFSLHNFAKLWECEAEWERDGANAVHFFEPLDVDLPEDVRASCYLGNVVGFYDREGHRKLAEVRHCAISNLEDLVLLDGVWYQVASGRVVYRDGRWCMQWLAYSNTRRARMMNTGFSAFQLTEGR